MPPLMRGFPILEDARSHGFPRSSRTGAAPLLRNLSFLLVIFALLGTSGCVGVVSKPGATPVGDLDVSPNPVKFGDVAVGASATQTVTVTNGGVGNVTLSKITMSGTGFSISGPATPMTFTPGESVNFTAAFKPTAAGLQSGNITITIGTLVPQMVATVTATGVAPSIGVTPTSISFGNVNVGNPVSQTIQLTNGGTANGTINSVSATGTGFSVSGLTTPQTLTPGQSVTFTAEFNPPGSGAKTGSISISSSSSSSPLDVSLSGTGVTSTILLTPSATSLSFGSVKEGDTVTKEVSLQNTGTADVDISTVSISGSSYTFSGVANGTDLTPGQTAVLTVKFDPNATGSLPGAVSIVSNAAGSPLAISLSGTGTSSSSAHSVALAWDPSTSTVVGYFVYRSSKPSGPFKKLNTTANADPKFTDSNVTNGLVYFYYVTAVDSSNIESSDSNQISITIPSD